MKLGFGLGLGGGQSAPKPSIPVNVLEFPAFTLSGAGDVSLPIGTIAGQGALTFTALSLYDTDGTFTPMPITGEGSLEYSPLDVSGEGSIISPITGEGALAFDAFAAAGEGTAYEEAPPSDELSPMLIVSSSNANGVELFSYDDTGFTAVSDPSLEIGFSPDALSFSPDGQYLAVGRYADSATTPRLMMFKRDEDGFTALTIDDYPAIGPIDASCLAWSPDGTSLAVSGLAGVSGLTGNALYIYKRTGDTFTKLNTIDINYDNGLSVAFSHSGEYLAFVPNGVAPYIVIYKRTGDNFAKIPNPAYIPSNNIQSIAWGLDDGLLLLGNQSSGGILTYSRSGDTFTQVTGYTNTGGYATSICFTPLGDYFIAGVDEGTSKLARYSVAETTLTKLSNPASLPPAARKCVMSGDGKYFFVDYASGAPYHKIYSVDSAAVLTEISSLSATVSYLGAAFYPSLDPRPAT
jgi:Tol biopolymer transport system component